METNIPTTQACQPSQQGQPPSNRDTSNTSSNVHHNTARRAHRSQKSGRRHDGIQLDSSDNSQASSSGTGRPPRNIRRSARGQDSKAPSGNPVVAESGRRRRPQQKEGARDHITDPQTDRPASANASTAEPDSDAHGEPSQRTTQPRSRRNRFNAKLTQPPVSAGTEAPPQSSPKAKQKSRLPRELLADDLTSTLTRALRTPPFPDCPICFCPIRPDHTTWSCSPSQTSSLQTETVGDDPDKKAHSQCCWTTFHLKCIRSWAEKSVRDVVEAWRARGEERPGEWRCPGCQTKREEVPRTYWCFCSRTSNPSPPRLSTPHSCALPCSRPRSSRCGHPCPLPCHPGPCPPCSVTVRRSCFCGKVTRNIKCSPSGDPLPSDGSQSGLFPCHNICDRPLSCKHPEHRCKSPCHVGPCSQCKVRQEVRCWCGRETKVVGCGDVRSEDAVQCVILKSISGAPEEEETWIGLFGCSKACNRPFKCGQHACSKQCHPPSRTPPPCPFDPSTVTHCACGRYPVARHFDTGGGTSSTSNTTPTVLPARTSCTSPLPVCSSVCSRLLPCGHSCKATCHWGACPPCKEQVEQLCRCGSSKRKVECGDTHPPDDEKLQVVFEEGSQLEFICNRPCPALRACGRHQCSRICCPLASLSMAKRKKKAKGGVMEDVGSEIGGLHECDIPCKRVLACGNHRCERKDHKGPCGVCLQSVFDELLCPCGRTALEPPIQCGTRLICAYPCAQPPPSCGHPHVPHACHEATIIAGADTADEGLGPLHETGVPRSCPPCPFLTRKRCACGKKMVDNVQCSQENVNCGTVCGRLLPCGFHQCRRTCHADECGPCTAICGKSRKSCLPEHHPCTQICHAPSACPESEPCLAVVSMTCPCGNLRSMVPCSSTKQNLKCNSDCAIKKRNARLAEAFGIGEKHDTPGGKTAWSEELVGYASVSANARFVKSMEGTLADFATSSRRTQVLSHMPPERRKFVQALAAVYRMDTTLVDQEPHRSVQLIRRIDTRVPSPLLSQVVSGSGALGRSSQASTTATSLGKLMDLRLPSPAVAQPKSLVVASAAQGTETVTVTHQPGMSTMPSAWSRASSIPYATQGPTMTSSSLHHPHTTTAIPQLGAGVAPSSTVTLGTGASMSPSAQTQGATETNENIPDDWEDDA